MFNKKSNMIRNYKFYDLEGLYFVSSAVVGWLDVFNKYNLKWSI